MMEHRGVGMSRHDDDGHDLPAAAITIDQVVDDLNAVLDDIGAERAVVYGCSYGTYLAAGLGSGTPGGSTPWCWIPRCSRRATSRTSEVRSVGYCSTANGPTAAMSPRRCVGW